MPQARHGANGVCTLAVAGSKLDGTGFEKLQIAQTQVAEVTCGGSEGGLNALSDRDGGVALFRAGVRPALDAACGRMEALFIGLGTMVTFGDDLRKRALNSYFSTSLRSRATELPRGAS